jgi:hypothetical protein
MRKVKLPKWSYTIFSVVRRSFYIALIIFGVAIILGAVALGLGMLYAFGLAACEAIQTTEFKEWLIAGAIMLMMLLGFALVGYSPKIVRWAWNKLLHGA